MTRQNFRGRTLFAIGCGRDDDSEKIINGVFLLRITRLNIPPNISVTGMPREFLRVLDAVLASYFSKKCVP